jgi:hypothetical protein
VKAGEAGAIQEGEAKAIPGTGKAETGGEGEVLAKEAILVEAEAVERDIRGGAGAGDTLVEAEAAVDTRGEATAEKGGDIPTKGEAGEGIPEEAAETIQRIREAATGAGTLE